MHGSATQCMAQLWATTHMTKHMLPLVLSLQTITYSPPHLEIDSHDNATPPLTKCIESAHMQCKPTHKELKLWVVVVVVLCCYQCTCRHLI